MTLLFFRNIIYLYCQKVTIKRYEMFNEYLKKLRSVGKQSFTIEQAMSDSSAQNKTIFNK